MKSIATLSDQYIGLQFRKDNGLPIDPTSIHFKGKVYTNPNTPFEFEINKGVLTNCVIKYNLIILHIVPNFKSGTVSIEGNRFTTPEDILGKYIKQELDISITANADVRNLQDYAIADVILYGDDIATQTIDPNEIKSIVDKYLALNLKGIVSPIIQNELSVDVTNAVTKAINNNLPNDISTEIAKVLSNKVDSEIAKQLSTKLDNAIKNANLAKNDRVAVFMKSDKDDGFYIESTTDGKPFYWSTLVFDEEKEIPKNIVDLIEQNGIQFTKAGKPVDNPDKYSISIDVDTNKITVITK